MNMLKFNSCKHKWADPMQKQKPPNTHTHTHTHPTRHKIAGIYLKDVKEHLQTHRQHTNLIWILIIQLN